MTPSKQTPKKRKKVRTKRMWAVITPHNEPSWTGLSNRAEIFFRRKDARANCLSYERVAPVTVTWTE